MLSGALWLNPGQDFPTAMTLPCINFDSGRAVRHRPTCMQRTVNMCMYTHTRLFTHNFEITAGRSAGRRTVHCHAWQETWPMCVAKNMGYNFMYRQASKLAGASS